MNVTLCHTYVKHWHLSHAYVHAYSPAQVTSQTPGMVTLHLSKGASSGAPNADVVAGYQVGSLQESVTLVTWV
jgi:hypothetical protein